MLSKTTVGIGVTFSSNAALLSSMAFSKWHRIRCIPSVCLSDDTALLITSAHGDGLNRLRWLLWLINNCW